MKPLWVVGVSGLYEEFYQPNTKAFFAQDAHIENQTLNACTIFWKRLLSEKSVRATVELLALNAANANIMVPAFQAILADKEGFVKRLVSYSISVCDQSLDEQEFFSRLETIEIFCQLHTALSGSSFTLNIQHGYLMNEFSVEEIENNCLNPAKNPYFKIVLEELLNLILDYEPDVIFTTGRITHFTAAVYKLIKIKRPSTMLIHTRTSSEYYSINKVAKYISGNKFLGKITDAVLLDNYDKNEAAILKHIHRGSLPIRDKEIILCNDNLSISQSEGEDLEPATDPVIISRTQQLETLTISPSQVFDIRVEPLFKCYWNRCAFCGINKKYLNKNVKIEPDVFFAYMGNIGTSVPEDAFLWLIDEAVHPEKLEIIADAFLHTEMNFAWQARCRIDVGLLKPGLAEKLANAGLKELRLGLESASTDVLQLMRKFDEGFSLNQVRQIVSRYAEQGIAIHFPMIIGFPGEEKIDRQRTYEFLTELSNDFPSTTFNINIFSLDVSSAVFKSWDSFRISEVSFPCSPEHYIGNIVAWDHPDKESDQVLNHERNALMRSIMFDWMPPTAYISPVVFYRLSETIRNTLIWRVNSSERVTETPTATGQVALSPDVVIYNKSKEDILLYNWKTHHFVSGGAFISRLHEHLIEPCQYSDLCQSLSTSLNLDDDDIDLYLSKLVKYGHLVVPQ